MKKLLFASRNAGKIKEAAVILAGSGFEVVTLESFPDISDVEEPAMTFEGNAIIKAMTVGKKTGMLTIAEDSGLEVDALDGRPGVFTARYAPGTDTDRYMKLLDEMKGVPEGKR